MRLVADDARLNKAGPMRKFYLLKQFGDLLRANGLSNDAMKRMSCAQLEAAIVPLMKQ